MSTEERKTQGGDPGLPVFWKVLSGVESLPGARNRCSVETVSLKPNCVLEQPLEVNSENSLQSYTLPNSFPINGIQNFAFKAINSLSNQFRNTNLMICACVKLTTFQLMSLFPDFFFRKYCTGGGEEGGEGVQGESI